MKKFLLFIFFITNLTFAIQYDDVKWHNTENIEMIKGKVQFGDIIVLAPKSNNLIHRFGHNLFVTDDDKFIDFPFIGFGFREFPLIEVKNPNRGFVVLRYKYMNDEIADKMRKLIDEDFYYRSYYIFSVPSNLSRYTYCSHFIWLLYRNTVGDIINFDYNLIRPLSFLESKYLEVVDID